MLIVIVLLTASSITAAINYQALPLTAPSQLANNTGVKNCIGDELVHLNGDLLLRTSNGTTRFATNTSRCVRARCVVVRESFRVCGGVRA